MADDNLNELSARAEDFAARAQQINQEFSEVRSNLGDINRAIGRAGSTAIEFRDALNSATRTSSRLSSLQSEIEASNKGTNKALKAVESTQSDLIKLQEAKNIAEQRALETNGSLSEHYFNQAVELERAQEQAESLLKELQGMAQQAQELDNNTKFFGQMANVVKSIPGLKGFSEPFQRAEKAARSIYADSQSSTKAFAAGAKEFGTEINKFASATFVKGFFDISKNSSNLAKQLNTSTQESLRIERSFRDLANSSEHTFVNTKNLVEANKSLNTQLGLATTFSGDILENFTAITKRLDISEQSAGNLVKLSAVTGQDFEDQTKQIIGQVEAFKAQTGAQIDNRAVLEDIGKLNSATLLTLTNQGVQLGRAAADIRRMGLNFEILEGSAQNLLNFESSIGAELEAELITGRELSLERARLAALTGDQATLARELARNFGTAAEFGEQSVIAQEAQAKALGMTREQLAKTLMQREALQKIGVKDDAAAKERFDLLVKQHGYTKAVTMLGDEQYAKQLRNQDIQEKFTDLIVRLQGVIISLVDGPMSGLLTLLENSVNAVSSVFSFLSRGGEAAETLFGSIAKVARFTHIMQTNFGKTFKHLKNMSVMGKTFAKGFAGIGRIGKTILKLASKLGIAGKALGGFGKVLGKVFGLGVLKKIPGIGLIIGVMQAISRWNSGDKAGALMSLGSGVLSTIPGLGTAASLAVDAIDIGTSKADFRKPKKEKNEQQVEDFVIKTHPKDTLVMAGGTKLGSDESSEKTNALIEKLITAVEKGGDVYIDGNKAGRSLALASYRSS